MIKQTVTQSQFIEAFRQCGRIDQFSYSALVALFEYLEDLSDDIGDGFELDPIAICCEFSEYESALEAARQYTGDNAWDAMTQENANESALNWLYNQTQVIQLDNGAVIIQDW